MNPLSDQLSQRVDIRGHAAQQYTGFLLGEPFEAESLEVAENADSDVVHQRLTERCCPTDSCAVDHGVSDDYAEVDAYNGDEHALVSSPSHRRRCLSA